MLKRLSMVVFMMLAIYGGTLSSKTVAQEATAEATDTTVTVGAIQLTLPVEWFAFPTRSGSSVLVSNIDLTTVTNNNYPVGTFIMQVTVVDISQLGDALMTDSPTAEDILKAAATDQPNLQTTVFEYNGKQFAKADTSTADYEQAAYSVMLDAQSFVLASAVGITPDVLPNVTDSLISILDKVGLNMDAPFPDDAYDYTGLAQSTSPEGFPQLGDPNAKVKIYEISSFDCSHCREFHGLGLPTVLARVATGDVLFVYVPYFGTGGIPLGDKAARGALCAGEQGKFWEYHDGVFNWQQFGAYAFSPERLLNGATQLALDVDAFNACLDSDATTAILRAAHDYAATVEGFQGTPTVIVNGQIVNWAPAELFDGLIQRALTTPEVTPEATAEVTPNS